MKKTNLAGLKSVLRGLILAVAFTLACIALLLAAVVALRPSDQALHAVNQIVKLLALLAGTRAAVGRGGKRGFLTGMTFAMLYMIAGYGLYLVLGGGAFDAAAMLGEILVGAAVGAVAGSICANLPARKARAR